MMNLSDPSMALLAAAGGETVKLFDVSVESGDPCTLTYTPSPGSLINSVKWNHTNLVLASAGEDKKISLWRKNGQSMGTIPVSGSDSGDNIEEIILAINFSNKASRYICSGGSGQVVRIWDLQRKRCIKWLKGHTSTITGTMYNCKDEHLASISEGGDLILHNLASGAKAAELKDPNQQVLKVLDYSRISRHLLVTTGDDGSVHLWDTTGRSPKVSWLKQHSAPTSGISFSPANDKVIASVGLDKKLYTYDSGSRRPSFCVAYEAPFSSFAFRDDGWVLAAGTTNGRVVFYDVRAKPQPFTVLRAYSSSEAVTSLCWQRSKAVIINESNCSAETVLLGGAVEDSILMPDPLPSSSSSSVSVATTVSRSTGLSGSTVEGSSSGTAKLSLAEETPQRSHLWPGGTLARLHAPRSSYNFKDDMEVFSPLVDVQPITPSLDKLWDDREGLKKDNLLNDKKPSSFLFPSSRRFNFAEDGNNDHPIFDWKANSASKQDDNRSSFMVLGGITPAPLTKGEESSITPPEAWGGERSSDKLSLRQSINLPSRFGLSTSGSLPSGSMFSGSHDVSSSTSQTVLNSLTNTNLNFSNLRTKDVSSIQETSAGVSEIASSSSMSLLLGVKNIDISGTTSLMPRRFSTYAERISTTSSFSDATSLSVGSPKMKKMGVETREDLLNSFLSRSETSSTLTESGSLPVGGGLLQQHKTLQPESQIGNSFTHQLIKRTFEETVDSFGKPVHEDIRNVHLEVIRQSHMLEVKFSNMMNLILENQAELMKEIKCLRKENQELRRLLP